MEFYNLNRLYDENLTHYKLSKVIDYYLLILMPVVVSFGCGISFINIIVFSSCRSNSSPFASSSSSNLKFASKKFLLSQSVFNFIFQVLTSIILITNYYESFLLKNYAFSNNKYLNYLNFKQGLNFFYEIILYCSLWIFIIGALEFSIISILKYHLNTNYIKLYEKKFHKQKSQLSNQLKLLEKLEEFKKYTAEKELKKQQKAQYHSRNQSTNSENYRNQYDNQSSDSNDTYMSTNNPASPNHPTYLHDGDTDAEDQLQHQNSVSYKNDVFQYDQPVFTTELSQTDTNQEIVETFYCGQKKIILSIGVIIFFAILLALPQLFAYEINHIFLSVSPLSSTQNKNKNNQTQNMPLNVYYIPQDNNDQFLLQNSKFDFSSNIAKAYALTIEFHSENNEARKTLDIMKKTHSNFFTTSSYYYLASRNYAFCNLMQNIETPNTPRFFFKEIYFTPNASINTDPILNLTIHCLKHSKINSYLAYNTIYFWFEHTMVISVPFSISLVVLISLLYVSLKFSRQISNQHTMRQQRKKFIKIQEKNVTALGQYSDKVKNKIRFTKIYKKSRQTLISTSSVNGYYNPNEMFPPEFYQYPEPSQQIRPEENIHHLGVMRYGENNEVYDEEYIKKHREYYEYYIQQQKMLQIKQKQKQQKKLTKDLKKEPKRTNAADYLNCFFKIDFKETLIDKKIKSKQHEDQCLNKMFILDLILYMIISCPYTFLRLVLDLFTKDKIKFSLDFFILYKFALLIFHIHLIFKFFLMLAFNIKFRASFAKAFSFEPSYCCVSNSYSSKRLNVTNQIYSYRSNSSGSSEYRNNSCLFYCCCFFCTKCFLSRLFAPYFRSQQSSNEFIVHTGINYRNEEIDRSTEFNTNLHQFQCPADPDQYKD